jgi:peptidoglycan/xylan/chitin deacetylase (PgdA/CDA1 family)
VGTGFGRWGRRGVVTLCYHGVRPRQARRFRRQMTRIARRVVGPAGIRPAEAAARWGPPRVCVTFDDAFANLLETALPVTRELDMPVAVFVVTGNLGAKPRWAVTPGHPDAGEVTMTAEQIRSAATDSRIVWGAHSITHRHLTELDEREAHKELAGSKQSLEALLGWRVDDFAFPYGDWNQALIEQAFACGFRRVHTIDGSHVTDRGEVVGRMAMTPDAWPIEFFLTANGGYGWLPHWRKLMRRLFWRPICADAATQPNR